MLYLSERCQIFVRLDDQTHVMGLMVKPERRVWWSLSGSNR